MYLQATASMQQVTVRAVQEQLEQLGYGGVSPAVIESYLQTHGRLAGALLFECGAVSRCHQHM